MTMWLPGHGSRAVVLLAGLALAGCGGSASTSASPSASASESPGAPASPMVVTRTGGFAGVHEEVRIAADGTAVFTSRDQAATPCLPDPTAVDRLRAMDLAAVAAAPSSKPWADGFAYRVTTAAGTASAWDGDTGLRAQLLAAAAAVVDSCRASAAPIS